MDGGAREILFLHRGPRLGIPPTCDEELGILTQNDDMDLVWVQQLMVHVFIARYSTLNPLGDA